MNYGSEFTIDAKLSRTLSSCFQSPISILSSNDLLLIFMTVLNKILHTLAIIAKVPITDKIEEKKYT